MDDEDGKPGQDEGEGKMREGEAEEDEEPGEVDEPPPPPLPEQEKELLFLIEFLVDTLTLMQENMNVENIDPCALQGPTRMVLTFLHFPPMILSEKDMDPDKRTGYDVIQFNAGKSLMFALTESQFEEPPHVYLLVEASKEMPHAFRIPFISVGKTKIQLSELFKQLFEKYDETPWKTVSKSIKDKYELSGEKGKTTAEVSIYIRLTCIGENIVTEFVKAEDPMDTVLFKNKESMRIYECKETEKPEENLTRTLPGWGKEKRPKPNDAPEAPEPSPPQPEDENFEEIFAQINGSVVVIKVEKSNRKEKPKEFHVSDFCDCNISLPQHLVAGLSDLSLSPASESSINFGVGRPVHADRKVGLDPANQLMFSVPPVEALAQPGIQNSITYNVKTCNEDESHGHIGKNTFRVITDNNYEGLPPNMPNDPEKDVFVLRIIKRGKKDKVKSIMEVEFKAPKEKIVPPVKPPYMVDRSVGQDKKPKKKQK